MLFVTDNTMPVTINLFVTGKIIVCYIKIIKRVRIVVFVTGKIMPVTKIALFITDNVFPDTNTFVFVTA